MGTQLLVRGGVATVASRSRDTDWEPQWRQRLIRFMAGLLEFGVRPRLADGAGMLWPHSVRSGPCSVVSLGWVEKCGWPDGDSFGGLGCRLVCRRSRPMLFPGVVIALAVAGEREPQTAHLVVRTSPDDTQGSKETSDLELGGQVIGGPQTPDSSLQGLLARRSGSRLPGNHSSADWFGGVVSHPHPPLLGDWVTS